MGTAHGTAETALVTAPVGNRACGVDRAVGPRLWGDRACVWVATAPVVTRAQVYFVYTANAARTWQDPRFMPKNWEQRIDANGRLHFAVCVRARATQKETIMA